METLPPPCHYVLFIMCEECVHWLKANTMQVCTMQEEYCIEWADDGRAMARI